MSFLRGQLCEVATLWFAVADLDSSTERGLTKPQESDQSATGLLDSVDSRVSHFDLSYVQESY
ncbi:hypothetical protein [Leptospira interrogans]|uniref:hypothetical protein n=1 Tax=Leptospira interrogans TaxID=173 RepID=UPI001EF0395E|nr:hypothetical protein [Leptospira interrogans]